MAFPVVPIGDKVIIKRDGQKEKTPGGIFLPDAGKEKPKLGVVVAANLMWTVSGKEELAVVAVGDRVIFPSYQGIEVEVDGETYLIVASRELLGIVLPE